LASRSDTEFASGLSARTAGVSAGDAVLFKNAHRREKGKHRDSRRITGTSWHAHALPRRSLARSPRTRWLPRPPPFLLSGGVFVFDNFQSRVGIRADGRPPARYHLEQCFRVRGKHVAYPYRHHAGCGERILRPRFRGSVRALVGRHRGMVLKRTSSAPTRPAMSSFTMPASSASRAS
jgi:hypothetical protein